MTVGFGGFNAAWLRRFRTALHRWYARHGRILPWRGSADAYTVWVSEVMLQQTTVAAVIPYFERFLTRFPDVHALAAADPDDVLRLWEGLGYYSRARHLHRAARTIVADYQGKFPRDPQVLAMLPGVGRYTAGAIASFAFGIPAPIVEANTLRLYSRLLSLEIDPRSAAGQREVWQFADWLVTSACGTTLTPGDLNQSLMDLGSTVCRPTDPACHECPLTRCCSAFQRGTQHTVPIRAARIAITDVTEVSVAIRKSGRFLVRQHVPPERWPGLWDFVRFPVAADDIPDSGGQSLPALWTEQIRSATGLTVEQASAVCQLRHAVTRFRIRLLCLIAVGPTGRVTPRSGYRWMPPAGLADLPLSVTCRRFLQRLQSQPASYR